MLIHKSTEFKIDLNIKDHMGWTIFHFSCMYGAKNVVKLLMKYSDSYNIDLTAKDWSGLTGFQQAKQDKEYDVVRIIKRTMPQIAF